MRHTVRAALTRAALRVELADRDAQIAGLRRQLQQLAASWDQLAGCSPAAGWPGAGGEDDFAFGGLPMPPAGWRPSWPAAEHTPGSTVSGRRRAGVQGGSVRRSYGGRVGCLVSQLRWTRHGKHIRHACAHTAKYLPGSGRLFVCDSTGQTHENAA